MTCWSRIFSKIKYYIKIILSRIFSKNRYDRLVQNLFWQSWLAFSLCLCLLYLIGHTATQRRSSIIITLIIYQKDETNKLSERAGGKMDLGDNFSKQDQAKCRRMINIGFQNCIKELEFYRIPLRDKYRLTFQNLFLYSS